MGRWGEGCGRMGGRMGATRSRRKASPPVCHPSMPQADEYARGGEEAARMPLGGRQRGEGDALPPSG